jgi:hypothetical protein
MQTGDYDRAFELFDAVLVKLPRDPATLTSKGPCAQDHWARQTRRSRVTARQSAAKPDHGDAWYALANLKTYKFREFRD